MLTCRRCITGSLIPPHASSRSRDQEEPGRPGWRWRSRARRWPRAIPVCCSWRWRRFGTLRSWRRRLPRRSEFWTPPRSTCRGAHGSRATSTPTLLVLDNFEQVLDAAPLVADLLVVGRRAPGAGHQPRPAPGARRAGVRCGTTRVGCRRRREVARRFRALARSAALRGAGAGRAPGLSPHGRKRPHRDGDLSTARCAAARPRAGGAVAQSADGRGSAPQAHAGCPVLDRLARAISPNANRTINATVAWSYHLLAPDEQRVFRRLGALPGRFPIEAAAAVVGGDEETSGTHRRSPPRSGRPYRQEPVAPSRHLGADSAAVPDARNRPCVRRSRALRCGRARGRAGGARALLHDRSRRRGGRTVRSCAGRMAGSRARRSRELPQRADVAHRARPANRSGQHRVGTAVLLGDPRARGRRPSMV